MQVASFLHDRINMHGAVRLHPTALPALHLALGAIAEVWGAPGRGSRGAVRGVRITALQSVSHGVAPAEGALGRCFSLFLLVLSGPRAVRRSCLHRQRHNKQHGQTLAACPEHAHNDCWEGWHPRTMTPVRTANCAQVRRQLAAEGRDVVAVPLGQVTCGGGVGGRRRQGSDDEEDAEHGGGPGGAAELGEGGDGDGDHPSPYGMRVSELADVAHNRICSTMMHAIGRRSR